MPLPMAHWPSSAMAGILSPSWPGVSRPPAHRWLYHVRGGPTDWRWLAGTRPAMTILGGGNPSPTTDYPDAYGHAWPSRYGAAGTSKITTVGITLQPAHRHWLTSTVRRPLCSPRTRKRIVTRGRHAGCHKSVAGSPIEPRGTPTPPTCPHPPERPTLCWTS